MIEAINTFSSQQQAATSAASGDRVTGQFRGETVAVVLSDPLADLQDAAEELTFVHSEKASKSLADRKTRDRASRAEEIARKYLEQVPDAGSPQRLYQFAQSLLQGSEPPTAQQLRQQLKSEYPEISHQYAALQFLEELLAEGDQNEDLLGSVRQLRQELDRDHGPEIRAGLNITKLATSLAELGEPSELRDFYRDTVLGFDELSSTYQQIVDQYGIEHFDQATDFLINAVGTELASFGPGADPRQLKATVDSLYIIEIARNLNNRIAKLFDTMSDQFQVTLGTSQRPLLSELLPLKEQRWVDASKIDAIVNNLGNLEPEQKIYLLRELSTIVRELPEKIYQSLDDRERLRTAIQGSLDQAIDAEGI